jgi:multidrug transporter EmrE-like cation transporter
MRLSIILVLLAGVSTTIANLLLKQSRVVVAPDIPWHERFFSFYFIGAMMFFIINLGLFTVALDDIPISVGYPILAASGFAMLAVSAAIIFGEHLGPWQIAGFLLLVLAGIFALAQGR